MAGSVGKGVEAVNCCTETEDRHLYPTQANELNWVFLTRTVWRSGERFDDFQRNLAGETGNIAAAEWPNGDRAGRGERG